MTNPPDLSTPALRNVFCLAHGIPGWLLFTPGEFAQIEMAHSRMKTEIEQWRLAAKTQFGATTPLGMSKAAMVRQDRIDALRHTLIDIIPQITNDKARERAQKGLNG